MYIEVPHSRRCEFKLFDRHLLNDSPEAILSVALFLVNKGRKPLRLDVVVVLPELNEEVGDLARRWQKALQV